MKQTTLAHHQWLRAAVLMAVLMIATITAAQFADNDGGYTIDWSTIDGGGGTSTGGTFSLSGTIGQPDASAGALTGGTYALVGGFWALGDAVPAPDTCPADINNNGLVNVQDLLIVISAWGACPVPPAACDADIHPQPTGNGSVNVGDLLMVISSWGVCPP